MCICSFTRLVALVTAATTARADDPTLVVTASGPVLGKLKNVSAGVGQWSQARTFTGIPFGTVERFQPPKPVAPWKQVRPALVPGATCEKAEQCLFLNVQTPWPLPPANHDESQAGLAVMLFIHGGCNKGGAGSQYQTDELLAAAKDVIVVTLNYRLGIFGWLGGKEVASQTTDGSSGNFGTQDQRAGMQWVQDNIAAFGGDPDRVLLFGESAGASAVSTHVISQRSKGLFAAAAIESGAFAHWNSMPFSGAQALYTGVQTAAGCSDIGCLLKMDWAEVYQHGTAASSPW
jgi:para-nitrobenzyl esterase